MKAVKLGDLAKHLGGRPAGRFDVLIDKVSAVEEAQGGSIVYAADSRSLELAEKSDAAALLIPEFLGKGKKSAIVCPNSRLAFARLLAFFDNRPAPGVGVHPTALVDKTAEVDSVVSLGAYAVVGARTRIGKGVRIGPLVFIDEDVRIGDDTVIHARAAVLRGVQIGKRCILYEGCVIGSEGFGYASDESGRAVHIPQTGIVILEDEVEVGANTAVDRATLGATRIGRGTKIDNLVQIAHNCRIGENCRIAGMTGIAGSVSIGAESVIGGHSGIRDHVKVGEKSVVAAATNVWGDLPPGSFVSGNPARPHKEQLKLYALIRKLPDLFKRLKDSK